MQAGEEVVTVGESAAATPDFATFFAEEHPRVFKALFFVVGNRADAAELAQDAFLKLWERWDSVGQLDDPTAYVFRVALNGFRMRARSARRAARRLVVSERAVDPFDEVAIREDVRQMLRSLAPRQRAALVLLDLYGYGSEDAARILGVRPSTVRALASQGRAVLRSTEDRDE
jgi:RNA polymerase sigma-70 factor, ECF subfamily